MLSFLIKTIFPNKEKYQGPFTTAEMDAFASACGFKWSEQRKKWRYPTGAEIDPEDFPWVFYMTVGNLVSEWKDTPNINHQWVIGRNMVAAASKLRLMGGRYVEIADDLQEIASRLIIIN